MDKESVLKSNRDIIYEILVPETGIYTFEISSECQEANYSYEIYSYNIYNGDYQSIEIGRGNSSIESNESINLITPNDFDSPYQVTKYYIRLWFDRNISDDYSINLSIEHPHSYTHHYENESITQHKAYCWCGEYITESHQYVDGVCTLCGEAHEHLYGYSWLSDTTHQEVCLCGDEGDIKPHVVKMGSFTGGTMYATCLLCGGRVSRSPQIILSVNQLPHTENGSYITPDGIIVLVDEDVEAFFNGELTFLASEGNLEFS